MYRKFIYIIFALLCFKNISAQTDHRHLSPEEYISLYKELAVVNMKEKKVPASITLAQAMLESDCGNSPLAQEAMNHFGIKCHLEWNGPTYHQDDDDLHECFRKYQNPLQSFEDHSDFLMSRERYNFLFALDITNYKGWAHGLKKAGYATNPAYASKLIDLIEKNKLYLLDEGKDLPVCKDATEPVINHHAYKKEEKKITEEEKAEANPEKKPLFYKAPDLAPEGIINGVPYLISKKGDSYFSVAKKKEMMLWQILKYNDADKNDVLKEGEIVFLKPKRMIAKEDSHLVKDGESMRSISQLHGIKLHRLYHQNNMIPGQEAMAGQKLNLK